MAIRRSVLTLLSQLVILPAVVALLVVGCGALSIGNEPANGTTRPAAPQPQVIIGGVTVNVELARSIADRSKGLGGHTPLGERDGMLFIFESAALHAFWMKGMTFPLDIIWIQDGKVVHLEANLPPPKPADTDATLPVYSPRAPALYVLEVNAGFAGQHGISVGTPVVIKE